MDKTLEFINDIMSQDDFIYGVWSNPRKGALRKITARPVKIKDVLYIQFAVLQDNKEYHHNIEKTGIIQFLLEKCIGFKQVLLFTSLADYQLLINKKGEAHIKKSPASKKPLAITDHNRKKNYLLDNEASKPFLKRLGLMSEDGVIKPSKYDKYKQINKYLETIETILPELTGHHIRIVDFGCGKSYLTFAMYHYFHTLLGMDIEIVGLDLKKDVIAFCNDLSKSLNYEHLNFQVGDIGQYTTDKKIDMVVSLHACNTATDSAIAKGLEWESKVILAVPCCHHECYLQINNDLLKPILKHGILKERIAALVTDGLRANLLEAVGYKVSVMEFIDMEHTPKNILLKAIRKDNTPFDLQAYSQYTAICEALGLDLSLAKMIKLPKA